MKRCSASFSTTEKILFRGGSAADGKKEARKEFEEILFSDNFSTRLFGKKQTNCVIMAREEVSVTGGGRTCLFSPFGPSAWLSVWMKSLFLINCLTFSSNFQRAVISRTVSVTNFFRTFIIKINIFDDRGVRVRGKGTRSKKVTFLKKQFNYHSKQPKRTQCSKMKHT